MINPYDKKVRHIMHLEVGYRENKRARVPLKNSVDDGARPCGLAVIYEDKRHQFHPFGDFESLKKFIEKHHKGKEIEIRNQNSLTMSNLEPEKFKELEVILKNDK